MYKIYYNALHFTFHSFAKTSKDQTAELFEQETAAFCPATASTAKSKKDLRCPSYCARTGKINITN